MESRRIHEKETSQKQPLRLRVWQRLFLCVFLLGVFALLSTPYVDFARMRETQEEMKALADASGWNEKIFGYAVTDDSEISVQLYTEGLAKYETIGRGTALELESMTLFTAEDGAEYYHYYYNGVYGYVLKENITFSGENVLQETLVYVRTPVNLLKTADGIALGSLAEKGTALSVVGYDEITEDGNVNMYQVKMGTETGWISADYVSLDFVGAMEEWDNDTHARSTHDDRGDPYGGGDAGELDYWPREKGDFAAEGNEMPESCYSLYIPAYTNCVADIDRYLALAENTEINTFVFSIQDNDRLVYPSSVVEDYGLLNEYRVQCSMVAFAEAVQKVQDAGYYTVCRITAFEDSVLGENYPEWSFCQPDGSVFYLAGVAWPSPYCREVWEYKIELALEAVELFGFDEVMFDSVQFPYGIGSYEESGEAQNHNENHEDRAQALQRFLIYATDVLHSHNTYISTVVYGETAEAYVDSYGHYWPAFSNVVDVICGTPYPDHFTNYYTSTGYYRAYQHPYSVIDTWSSKVTWRQQECGSPAKVRTWIQIWNDTYYTYNAEAIQREILALYDNGLTDGYMPWSYYGDYDDYTKMLSIFHTDYYSLWQEAEARGVKLSEYMEIDTSDDQ